MLYLLELVTHVIPHIEYLKQKSISCFIACFNSSCGIFVYNVEKSKVETEVTLFVLFSLLIAESTAVLLTPEKNNKC